MTCRDIHTQQQERQYDNNPVFESKFGDRKVAITTISMDNKPFVKKYIFNEPNVIKNHWKSLTKCVVDSHRTWKNTQNIDYLA